MTLSETYLPEDDSKEPEPGPLIAPLSVVQQQLWYMSRLVPDGPVYHEVVAFERHGPFDPVALRAALNEILQRHEAWRTSFQTVDGEPVQVVQPPSEVDLPMIDLSPLDESAREQRAATLIAEASGVPYPIDKGPLLRLRLVRLTPELHRLYLVMHHLIFDGVSVYRIVLPELSALYDEYSTGVPGPPRRPAVPYRDMAEWQRTWMAGPEARRRLDYWKRHLADVPTLELTLDHPRPASPRFRGSSVVSSAPPGLVGAMRTLAAEARGSLFHVVATAFAILLRQYAGQDELVFGTAADFRQRPEFRSVVGYCLTPLVVRVDLDGESTVVEAVRRVRNDVFDAMDHLVPFEEIVRETRPERDARRNPLFQAMVIMEPPATSPDLSWSPHSLINSADGGAKFDLELTVVERADGSLGARLIFDCDLVERATAQRIMDGWMDIVQTMVVDATRSIASLPTLGEADANRLLVEWNATHTDVPAGGVADLVSAQARRTPSAPAITWNARTLTYREVEERSDGLARYLVAHGVAPGDLVAVGASRSPELILALLAVLKCGAAYLPLDPALPPDRLLYMLRDSQASTLVGDPASLLALSDAPCRLLPLDPDGYDRTPDVPRPPTGDLSPARCYVLYTSGSTGRPKGVPIEHASVVNLITSMTVALGLGPRHAVLAHTTVAFDIAVMELWLPLAVGSEVVLGPTGLSADGPGLARMLAEHSIDMLQATPATWQILVDSGWEGRTGLLAVCGGDTLSPGLAEAILATGVVLFNAYGPTETTVWSTFGRVEAPDGVTIGRPIANTQVYVVDAAMRPVPLGAAGELLIAGAGLSSGYLRQPELTNRRFVANPFRPSERIYRTGDRVRWLPDGRLEHLGRLDRQIKLRGFRVEPGEIEAALLSHPGIAAATVMARDDPDRARCLVAYVVASGEPPSVNELRRHLRGTLPEYMIPAFFLVLDELPLTHNGKLDLAALSAPDHTSDADFPPADQAPRDELERRLGDIWATILGRRVGMEDNFFDVGGHSLMALRLLDAVERDIRARLPLTVLLESGATIRGLADWISRRDSQPTHPIPSGRLLFFVLPHEAAQLALRHFVTELAGQWIVVPLVVERIGWRFDRTRTIGDLAEKMLLEIRRRQPHGPYAICGYSLGGLLAYEGAGLLREAGETVDWLGLLDTPNPDTTAEVNRAKKKVRGRRLRRLWTSPRAVWNELLETAPQRANHLLEACHLPTRPVFDGVGAHALAAQHVCIGHDAPLTVFATDETEGYTVRLGWDAIHRGTLDAISIPGTHRAMLKPPNVEFLASKLAGSLPSPDPYL
jgi:amino acid adenylation domain-containing protein